MQTSHCSASQFIYEEQQQKGVPTKEIQSPFRRGYWLQSHHTKSPGIWTKKQSDYKTESTGTLCIWTRKIAEKQIKAIFVRTSTVHVDTQIANEYSYGMDSIPNFCGDIKSKSSFFVIQPRWALIRIDIARRYEIVISALIVIQIDWSHKWPAITLKIRIIITDTARRRRWCGIRCWIRGRVGWGYEK